MFENKIDILSIFTMKNIMIYFIIINLISFLAMWVDKIKAKKGKWRISEATLFIISILGGSIGGIAGMYTFRHKTKKYRFTIGLPIIFIIEILIIITYLI